MTVCRQFRIGENVFLDPRIVAGATAGAIRADGVQQEPTARAQTAAHGLHVSAVILGADVLKHAYGINMVEVAASFAIVFEPNFDGQTTTPLAAILALLARDRDADPLDSVFSHRVLER